MERSSRFVQDRPFSKGGQQGGNLPSARLVANDYPIAPFSHMNEAEILSLSYNRSA